MTLTELRTELQQRGGTTPAQIERLIAEHIVDPERVEGHRALARELQVNIDFTRKWFVHLGRQLIVSEEVAA
jgi:hypothetical protein